ncbi:ParA family protein [archaeon]|nr:ParA family protein [archaeon]
MKKVFSILNHKGGVGKSTLSTNLAGYFANKGSKVMVGDFDVQQSTQNWLSHRPSYLAPIVAWEINNGQLSTKNVDIDYIIVDSPAGIRATSLKKLVSMSDKVIVPLRPGFFDILSTQSFLEEIVEIINEQEKETDICLVGNMVDLQTRASEQLQKFIQSTGLSSPTMIRQAQIYVHLAAHGLTLFDSKSNIFENEIKQWEPLIDWLLNDDETQDQDIVVD